MYNDDFDDTTYWTWGLFGLIIIGSIIYIYFK